MGGTSTDISLIAGGAGVAVRRRAGWPASASRCAASTSPASAAGGGSIAQRRCRRHAAGRPGKRGRGARPGLLRQWRHGRDRHRRQCACSAISMPTAFMGGKRPLDRAALGRPRSTASPRTMELSRVEAAAGIYRMINLNMAEGIRLMTPAPRRRSARLCAAELSAAPPACTPREVARELEIPRVDRADGRPPCCPAWGMLPRAICATKSAAPISARHACQPTMRRCARCSPELEQQAPSRLRSWFEGPDPHRALGRDALRRADLRDRRPARRPRLGCAGSGGRGSRTRFHARHEELYTYASRDQEVVFVNARVAGGGRSLAVRLRQVRHRVGGGVQLCSPRSKRQAFFGGWREVPVAMRSTSLRPGAYADGPRDHRGRDHDRAGRQPATASRSMRWDGSIFTCADGWMGGGRIHWGTGVGRALPPSTI